jgi:hypothetical protein
MMRSTKHCLVGQKPGKPAPPKDGARPAMSKEVEAEVSEMLREILEEEEAVRSPIDKRPRPMRWGFCCAKGWAL